LMNVSGVSFIWSNLRLFSNWDKPFKIAFFKLNDAETLFKLMCNHLLYYYFLFHYRIKRDFYDIINGHKVLKGQQVSNTIICFP
jgi:hypothetical protein